MDKVMLSTLHFIGFLLTTAAHASDETKTHGILLGVGNQYALEGIGYTYRFNDLWASGVGLGTLGFSLNGRVSPIENFRTFYIQIGYSPIGLNQLGHVYFGPEVGVGLERKTKAFAVNFNLGIGTSTTTVLGSSVTYSTTTGALGLGYNF